jgi:hypothetical protein
MCSSVFPVLSNASFKVSDLQLSFLFNFELIFEQFEKHGSSFSFLFADIQFSQHICLTHFFPLHDLGTFVKNWVGVAVWIHIWVLYTVPLVFVSVFFWVSASTMMFLLL